MKKLRLRKNIKIILFVILLFFVGLFLFFHFRKKSIIGTWKHETKDYSYTFQEKGNGRQYAVGTILTFTYTYDKKIITITYTGESDSIEIPYKIEKDSLIMDDSLGIGTIYIKEKK